MKVTDERLQDRPHEKQAVMLLLLKPTAILALKYIFKVQTSAVTRWKASQISLEWTQLWNDSHDKHFSPQTCKEKQQPSVLIKGPYQNLFTFQSICFKHAGCSSSKLTVTTLRCSFCSNIFTLAQTQKTAGSKSEIQKSHNLGGTSSQLKWQKKDRIKQHTATCKNMPFSAVYITRT